VTAPATYRMRRDSEGALHRVVLHDGFEGFVVKWTATCSGCFESEDGHPVGNYPFDEKAKCYLGAGCEECGYSGKTRREGWVAFDMGAYAVHEEARYQAEQRQAASA
jgi:outer membrane protease